MGFDYNLPLSLTTAFGPILSKENNKLDFYLAGLIEGDGSIKLPKTVKSEKGKILYPSITVTFASKDLPLAQFLSPILSGTINKAKGEYYVLSVYSLKALHSLCQRINNLELLK